MKTKQINLMYKKALRYKFQPDQDIPELAISDLAEMVLDLTNHLSTIKLYSEVLKDLYIREINKNKSLQGETTYANPAKSSLGHKG